MNPYSHRWPRKAAQAPKKWRDREPFLNILPEQEPAYARHMYANMWSFTFLGKRPDSLTIFLDTLAVLMSPRLADCMIAKDDGTPDRTATLRALAELGRLPS